MGRKLPSKQNYGKDLQMARFRVPVIVTTRGYVIVESTSRRGAIESALNQEWEDHEIDVFDAVIEVKEKDDIEKLY